MIMGIGITAGDIWHYLDGNQQVMLEDLLKNIDYSRDLVLMSLGWLSREGHITIDDGDDFRITLRK